MSLTKSKYQFLELFSTRHFCFDTIVIIVYLKICKVKETFLLVVFQFRLLDFFHLQLIHISIKFVSISKT